MNEFVYLQRALRTRGSGETIAVGAKGSRSIEDLVRDVAAVRRQLPDNAPGKHALLAFQNDRYHFVVSILAAWTSGLPVALPPNTRRKAVIELAEHPDTCCTLHDLGTSTHLHVPEILESQTRSEDVACSWDFASFSPDTTIATVYTSGTTAGIHTPCPKNARQLLGEAIALQQTFRIPRAGVVATTVQPGHIYGLLYTVLLPLFAQATLLRDTPFYPDAVEHSVSKHQASVLVTVPAHLRSLLRADTASFASLQRIFSSTAPLDPEVAREFKNRYHHNITEVLGSSETGGIAARLSPGETRWRPLYGSTVRSDDKGRLRVSSTYATEDGKREAHTPDLIELHPDGTFTHLGRTDGVLKIGGRRVSLPAMERLLSRLAGVHDAAVIALPTVGAREHTLLAAISPASNNTAEIQQALREHYPESCIPRRIKAVDELPREDNGKLSRGQLLRIFNLDEEGNPLQWDLHWHETAPGSGNVEPLRDEIFAMSVPSNYAWFDGHFPGYPVLAAAVQLQEILRPALNSMFGDALQITSLSRLKFTGRILPGDELKLHIIAKGPGDASFRISNDREICSSGNVHFNPEPSTR